MSGILQDLRHGVRVILAQPGFSLVAILTLALGIGANTAIFSVINGVLLRELPYAEAERLVALFEHERDMGESENPTSPASFLEWRRQSTTVEEMTAARPWSPTHLGADHPLRIDGLLASSTLFRMLGVPPLVGRTFAPGDGARTVVLSYPLWQRRFGGDPATVGSQIRLDGESYEVAGVMPPGFRFPPFWHERAEMWAPLALDSDDEDDTGQYLRAFGKLTPGSDLAEARSELASIAARIELERPESHRDRGVRVVPLIEPVVGDVRPALLVMMGAVGFVLLIACSNVANLLLSRATVREREMAVRSALGAGRLRLVRQLLVESGLLTGIGGLAGLLLGVWGAELLMTFGPEGIPRTQEVVVDGRVLAFTTAVTLVSALLLGLAPAWRTTRRGIDPRAMHGRGLERPGTARSRNLLVTAEVALALTLLIGAGLLLKNYQRLRQVDPGFDSGSLVTMTISLTGSAHEPAERQLPFIESVEREVLALPGVERVGFVNHLHIGGDLWRTGYRIDGEPVPEVLPRASMRTVTPGFRATLGLPLLAGRDFDPTDGTEAVQVVLVNRSLAQREWPGGNAVGARLKIGSADSDGPWRTVIGVVGDARQSSLADEVRPEIYFPYTQNPVAFFAETSLVARTDAGVPVDQAPVEAIRARVWQLDATLPIDRVRTMSQIVDHTVARQRFEAWLLAVFAGSALVLALIGIYGVVSYAVARSRREFGIRLALGARRRDILQLVLGRGMAATIVGVGLGLVASLGLTRVLASQLHEVSPTDPATFIAVAGGLILAALVGCYLPARRAVAVDPAITLRDE